VYHVGYELGFTSQKAAFFNVSFNHTRDRERRINESSSPERPESVLGVPLVWSSSCTNNTFRGGGGRRGAGEPGGAESSVCFNSQKSNISVVRLHCTYYIAVKFDADCLL
jgi:hypothetical protein